MLKIIACSALTLLSASVMAQTESESRELYAPGYFTRYAPQNADDMVSQVPGFTLANNSRDGNNDSQRGLGQGLGNLLINGKRPSTKDDGPSALLARIPAAQVLRIEILNEGSAELSGQSGKIVNVIAAEPAALSTSWRAQYHALEDGYDTPKLDGSVTGKWGSAKFVVGLDIDGNQFPQWGLERHYDADNTLYELQDEVRNFTAGTNTINASLAWDTDDLEANLSLVVTDEKSTFEESSDRFGVNLNGGMGAQYTAVDYESVDETFSYELSGDYTWSLSEGELKLIALLRRSTSDNHANYSDLPVDDDRYLFNSFSKADESENILRGVYSFEPVSGHRLELAGEVVENVLDTHANFQEDTGSGFSALILDGSDTEVSEERAELSLQYSTAFSESLSFQASLASEYSKISVEGDESRSESFVRPKGYVSFSWAQSDVLRIRSRLERSVGQLDFYDFASSENANDGTTLGGNTALVPDQTLRAELSFERQMGLGNSLTVTVFDEKVEDFITFVPMSDGGEGKGNIDSLDRRGVDVSLTINTEHFGVPGGKLDINAEIHTDEFKDPLTGETIEFRSNGHNPEYYLMSFRQDIPQTPWAWGVILEERSGNIVYRRSSIRDQDHSGLQAHRLFVEHKDIWGLVGKLEVEDVFGFTYENDRTWFVGDRGGVVQRRELGERHSPWVARLSLSGTF